MMKKTSALRQCLAALLAAIVLFACVSCSEESGFNDASDSESLIDENYFTPGEYSLGYEDEPSDGTANYTIAYPAPKAGIVLPETIPQTMLDSLKNRLDSTDHSCAMYYCDLETGMTISYNGDRKFGAASLVKAPYLVFIFEMLDNGELTLDDTLTYVVKYHKFGGTGSVKNMPDGTQLTLREIIEHIVIESDNTAFKMLYNTYGSSKGILSLIDFNAKAREEFDATFLSATYGTVLSANGVGRMFTAIYERSLVSENYAWFVDLMKQANHNIYIKYGIPRDEEGNTKYEVAHKYGMDVKASNDAAIVYYGDRPYLLIVLTDFLVSDSNSPFIRSLSSDIFRIHEYICDPTAWS